MIALRILQVHYYRFGVWVCEYRDDEGGEKTEVWVRWGFWNEWRFLNYVYDGVDWEMEDF